MLHIHSFSSWVHGGRTAALLTLLVLAGCAVGPNYQRPDAPSVDRYTARPLPASTASAETAGGDAQRFLEGEQVPQRWWTSFDSPDLDHRVHTALAHSPTVASARAALRQAQETAEAAGGNRWPSVDASAGVTRQKQSSASFSGAFDFPPLTVYNASVKVGYVLDLFGGVRRGIEAQQALASYQQAQLDATYLTLAANVVTASLQEASLGAQVDATEDIVDALSQQLDIAKKQQAIGAKSLSDTLAVHAQLSATQATLPPLRKALAAVRNQLATYLGATPAQLEMQPLKLTAVTLPTDIPVSLPSTLVAQRPDIRAASAQLHAATAQVGVAAAAMLPQINLSASGGSSALDAGDLFAAGTRTWSLGLNLLQPIFHGGQLRHRKRAAQAARDKALADWKQTVLSAFQNVADTLQALQFDAQSLKVQDGAERNATKLLSLTRDQFKVGAVDYINLLDAQRQYQQARIALIKVRSARLADTAALYAALGGGWQAAAEHTSATDTPAR